MAQKMHRSDLGTVIRRRKSAAPKRQSAYVEPACNKLRRQYFRADRNANRARQRDPRQALQMIEEGNEALIKAAKQGCAWLKKLRPRTVHLRGLGNGPVRETVTCRRLKKKYQRYRLSNDQSGMWGAYGRAKKLHCKWA